MNSEPYIRPKTLQFRQRVHRFLRSRFQTCPVEESDVCYTSEQLRLLIRFGTNLNLNEVELVRSMKRLGFVELELDEVRCWALRYR